MNPPYLRIGMGPPYVVRATVLATADLVPTAVTGAFFEVTKPDGSAVEWAASLSSQTAASLVAVKSLAVSDLDQYGQWSFWAKLLIPGGFIRTEVQPFVVLNQNQQT